MSDRVSRKVCASGLARDPKGVRPRKGDQRGTKPRSRPLAPIGGSSAAHFLVIIRCDNETHGWFDSRFSVSELGQRARLALPWSVSTFRARGGPKCAAEPPKGRSAALFVDVVVDQP